METIIMGYIGFRIWGIWGSYYNIRKATFYLLKGDYTSNRRPYGGYLLNSLQDPVGFRVVGFRA